MIDERCDERTRESGDAIPGRRGVLATLLALGAVVLVGTPGDIAVGKKKKKRCKKKCPPVDEPLTCADVCEPDCTYCYQRTAGSPLCGVTQFYSMTCTPCETDGQCVGTNFPYCLSARTEQASGLTQEISCMGSPPGRCGRPQPCAT